MQTLIPDLTDRQSIDRQALIKKSLQRVQDLHHLQKAGLICKSGDFFPSVHYPPITMYDSISEEELFADYTTPADGLLDVYAHIPFCEKKCVFCHYPVKLGEQSAEKDLYLDALEKEMDLYLRRLGLERIKARSILVGGGTPTFLSLGQLRRFLEFFVTRVDVSTCTQFNYDVDPITLIGLEGEERLRMMRDYGVDRLTIGVQSLDDEILKMMNRHHDTEEALLSIENAQKFGYQVDIEFIFGYPGQTLDNWIDVMEEAVSLGVEEIQLYRLKVEAYGDYQATIKAVRERGLQAFPSVEESIMMKQIAIDILKANGYLENLRRVYSKERKYYSHYADNQCCGLLDQVGFGLTAFSSLRDRFVLNTQFFEDYYQKISQGKLPLNRGKVRSHEEQMRWAIVLPLKNRCVWKQYYSEVTGGVSLDEVFRLKIEALKSFGLLVEDEEKIQLTQLGAFFADEVAQQFHHPDYIPYARDDYEQGPLYPYNNCQP
ncbi:coproporphyrinogen-III oxidase family protein [Crocosphaera sp.]|uniref:coproporphyrinogen-III oxidase family protein n=1 Tax=Crocosphaera sp. TaxID=2729996 RepID=UPI003F20B3FC|nr:radical SAM protein [Crocosphaera sp.]